MLFFMTIPVGDSQAPSANERLEHLIREVSEGRTEALADLYEAIRVSVYAYALSLLKNPHDAQDILHDTVLSIYNAKSYRPDGKPMAWILTIARNHCYAHLRKQSRTSDIPTEEWERYLGSREKVSAEDRLVLEQCLTALSEEESQIVVMHAVAGIKHRQIAVMLDMPLATVLSKYSRALKKIKKAFAGEE